MLRLLPMSLMLRLLPMSHNQSKNELTLCTSCHRVQKRISVGKHGKYRRRSTTF